MSAGDTDILRKNDGVRAMEGRRSLNVRNVERNIMDSVGHGATHHPTKIHRKEEGKETQKETAREPRKVESSKEEKVETKGKEKVKERKDNVSTKSQNHQKNSGQVDVGNNGRNDLGMLKQTLRVGGTMIGTQQIPILRTLRQLRNFNMRLSVTGDSRIWVLSKIESVQHDRLDPSQRTITFGIDTAACKTVVFSKHPAARGYLVHKDSLLGCAYSTAGRDKVYDHGKRFLCTSDGHREQKSQLPTTLDGGHRYDRLWSMGLFWTTKTRFQF